MHNNAAPAKAKAVNGCHRPPAELKGWANHALGVHTIQPWAASMSRKALRWRKPATLPTTTKPITAVCSTTSNAWARAPSAACSANNSATKKAACASPAATSSARMSHVQLSGANNASGTSAASAKIHVKPTMARARAKRTSTARTGCASSHSRAGSSLTAPACSPNNGSAVKASDTDSAAHA